MHKGGKLVGSPKIPHKSFTMESCWSFVIDSKLHVAQVKNKGLGFDISVTALLLIVDIPI